MTVPRKLSQAAQRGRLALQRWLARKPAGSRRPGFSLLEALVAMAVLSLFVVLMAQVTDTSFKLWRSMQSSVTMFESARTAYDAMTRRLSQATLNTYLDYYDRNWLRRDAANAASFVPSKYGRASDLQFLSGTASTILGGTRQGHGVFFFAPLGFTNNDAAYADLPHLLNAVGYYVEFGSDQDLRPPFLAAIPATHRFRLIENILPSQKFPFYQDFTDSDATNDDRWISSGLMGADSSRHVLAENVIALLIRPEVPAQDAKLLDLANPFDLTTDFTYDSRAGRGLGSPIDIQFAQLPPLVRVVMVAVDEKSARRLTNGTTPPDEFTLRPTWFTDPAKLDADLKSLSDQLSAAGVQFRIFNQVIALRGAKFSAQKEK